MSETERQAFYTDLENLIRAGATNREVAEHFSFNPVTARRHINYVKGLLEGEKRARSAQGQERTHPPQMIRATTVITDQSGLDVFSKPITLRGGRSTSIGNALRLGQLVTHPESGEFRLEDTDSATLRAMSPADLIPLVLRVSPEMSRALYDFLRMANPGWTLRAFNVGTDEPNDQGQQFLNFAIKTLDNRPGKTANTTFNSMLAGEFVRGALFCEMVLSPKDARTFVDIVTPDPFTVAFRVINDPDTGGQGFELVQGKGRDAIVLKEPTIKYISVDPLPGTPYGTSPLAPGLFPCLFILTMFQDARRVVAQQGWPRLNIAIDIAAMLETMPAQDQQDTEKVRLFVQEAINQVAAAYTDLQPDQAFVHTSTVKFEPPIGAIGDLEGVAPLFDVLERMAVRSLKSMPLLMGMPEGVSEANANRQWEVHVVSIRAMQNIAESALSSLFTLYLEANGIAAEARFKFDEMRAIEELREAQTHFQKLENAQASELAGYRTHDEASVYAVGKPAANTEIGVIGDKNVGQGKGKTFAGDTGDEKPIQGDDGAKRMETLIRMLENPVTAQGVAYGVALAGNILGDESYPALADGIRVLANGHEEMQESLSDTDDILTVQGL